MTNFKSAMNDLSNAFERRKRDNGDTYYALKEGSPEWMTDAIRAAHEAVDGRLPDDWIYEAIASLASNYNVHDDVDTARDQDCEICDGLIDIYTGTLTEWLASHIGNVALCNEAQTEGLIEPSAEITDHIKMGQFIAYQRISGAVLHAVDTEARNRDSDEAEKRSDAES